MPMRSYRQFQKPPAANASRDVGGLHPGKIFASFDSRRTAAATTEGNVYRIGKHDAKKVFTLDIDGKYLLYVTTDDYKGYRDVVEQITGQRASTLGKDVDHNASRKVEKNLGQAYVLVSVIDQRINRGQGRSERTDEVGRRFNKSASSATFARGGGHATPMNLSQMLKAMEEPPVPEGGKRLASSEDFGSMTPEQERRMVDALMLDRKSQQNFATLITDKIYDGGKESANAERAEETPDYRVTLTKPFPAASYRAEKEKEIAAPSRTAKSRKRRKT